MPFAKRDVRESPLRWPSRHTKIQTASDHPKTTDELREIRTRWFVEQGIEVVVDVYDGRVVTVWRKGRTS